MSVPNVDALRESLRRFAAADAGPQWLSAATELWAADPSVVSANLLCSLRDQHPQIAPSRRLRVFVSRAVTCEPLVPQIRAESLVSRVDLELVLGDFNTWMQELLAFDRPDRFDVHLVMTRGEDLSPPLWNDFASLSTAAVDHEIERVLHDVAQACRTFRASNTAKLVLCVPDMPAFADCGVLDAQLERSQAQSVRLVQSGFRQIAQDIPGVVLLDYDGVVARSGRASWYDQRMWELARMPFSKAASRLLSAEFARVLVAMAGANVKAVAVDLDNTLWRGVIGEDGLDGIAVAEEGPGRPHWLLQRHLKALKQRGILLTILSKNNEADALRAIREHPGMVLRETDFTAMRIDWNEKSHNIVDVAAELGIGVDAFAFLDDNPVERAAMRRDRPEVAVLEMPSDASVLSGWFRQIPMLERAFITEEDRNRSVLYAVRKEQQALERNVGNRESFLAALEQVIDVTAADQASITRIAQLTQKTNQFNLTTRRYDEAAIAAMANDAAHVVVGFRVRDRFADHGLVGVGILETRDHVARIDTLLLSCRVIGRDVERAMLAHLVSAARDRGCHTLRGEFIPTAKNSVCARTYEAAGFDAAEPSESSRWWSLRLDEASVET
jgi:FkbH-like protein